jgi:hypothetical protein
VGRTSWRVQSRELFLLSVGKRLNAASQRLGIAPSCRSMPGRLSVPAIPDGRSRASAWLTMSGLQSRSRGLRSSDPISSSNSATMTLLRSVPMLPMSISPLCFPAQSLA